MKYILSEKEYEELRAGCYASEMRRLTLELSTCEQDKNEFQERLANLQKVISNIRDRCKNIEMNNDELREENRKLQADVIFLAKEQKFTQENMSDAVAAEREACAKECETVAAENETHSSKDNWPAWTLTSRKLRNIADIIRNRGKK